MEFKIVVPDQVAKADPDQKRFEELFQMMMNRMANSHFKYGVMKKAYPHKKQGIKSAKEYLKRYTRNGNQEGLIDAANFLLIEFLFPSHKKAHFEVVQPKGGSTSLMRYWRDQHGSEHS